MQLQAVRTNSFNAPARATARPDTSTLPADRFESGSDSGPQLMVGVPTGFLSPQIPPPNSYFVTSVGIELAPGLGISLDGKALLIGHRNTQENFDIIGHLEDGTYPQRDFKVSRQGESTTVDGLYAHQDYRLEQQGANTVVTGDSDVRNFTVVPGDSGFTVQSKYSGRTWHVTQQGNTADIVSEYDGGIRYHVTRDGDTTRVETGHPEIDFTVTRQADGSTKIDGQLNPQDFTVTSDGDKTVVQGYYPQQKYVIG